MTNPNYGHGDGMLVSVINATNTGIGQMLNLNNSVMSLANALPTVNNSTSGVRLAGLLSDWNQNHSKIISELEQLNGKASGLLRSNRNVETETSAAPQWSRPSTTFRKGPGMTAFDVDHNGHLEINEQLYKAVGNLGVVVDDLNSALRDIPQAAWGGAQPIWLEYQTRWNAAYQEMVNRINASTVSSINVHEIFKQGDNRGAQIFVQ